MNIVSWNCCYNYRTYKGFTEEKYKKINEYNPDILIVYECTKNEFDKVKRDWKYRNWYCDDMEDSVLGVAIFSKYYKIEFTDYFNRNFRYIIPYKISGYKYDLILFAIWTKKEPYYYENIFSAIDSHLYDNYLKQNSIFIGDFNTGLIEGFSEENKEIQKEHNKLYRLLLEKLHLLENVTLNTKKEYSVTYSHNKYDYYLNDFCFVSKNIKLEVNNINIPNEKEYWIKNGEKNYWNGLSDHCPIIIELK